MSLNLVPVKAEKVYDPRINLNSHRDYVVLKGGRINQFQTFQATGSPFTSGSSISITCNPPSRANAVCRKVLQNYVVQFTITGTNTSGGPLLNSGYYGPRSFPLERALSTPQMQIENESFNLSSFSNMVPDILCWYHDKFASKNGELSTSPSMPDQFQEYSLGAGSIRNPLGDYGDNSYDMTRGGFAGISLSGNTNGSTSVVLTLNVTSPIMIPPFEYGCDSDYAPGFIGVQSMLYTAALGDLSRMLSIVANQGAAGQINITSVVGSVTNVQLLFEYLTPPMTMLIPHESVYNYYNMILYPTTSGSAIAPSSTVNLTMQAVQVSSVPRRVYLWAGDDQTAKTSFTSDTFFKLNSLTVTWGTQQLLSNATDTDLFNIACKNGYSGSWTQWSSKCGSLLCLEWGTDIGLDDIEAPGMLQNTQLSIQANFTNVNSTRSIAPTLYVVVVYEGIMNIVNGSVSKQIGVLSKENVLKAEESKHITYKKAHHISGGDFFSSLKKIFGKVRDVAKDYVIPAVRDVVVPGVKLYRELAGKGGRRPSKCPTGSRKKCISKAPKSSKVVKKGSALYGGQGTVTREEFRDRIDNVSGSGFDNNNISGSDEDCHSDQQSVGSENVSESD